MAVVARSSVKGPTQILPSHVGISEGVVKAQQAISDKYGVVTFDVTGKISTVPSIPDPVHLGDTGTGGLSPLQFTKNVSAIHDYVSTFIPTDLQQQIQQQTPQQNVSGSGPLTSIPQLQLSVTDTELQDLDRQISDLNLQASVDNSILRSSSSDREDVAIATKSLANISMQLQVLAKKRDALIAVKTTQSAPAPIEQNIVFTIKGEDGAELNGEVLEPHDYNFVSSSVGIYKATTHETSKQIAPSTNFPEFYINFAINHQKSKPTTIPSDRTTTDITQFPNKIKLDDKTTISLGNDFFDAYQKNLTLAKPQIDSAPTGIQDQVKAIDDKIKKLLISSLPKTPDQAINAAINIAIAGATAFISGEILGLGLEAVYPTKHLGVTEIIAKALDYAGIGAITSSLYGIVVASGFRVQLEYYFNFNLQPKRTPLQTITKALHYRKVSIDDVKTELKYEGYNNDAIKNYTDTIYDPLNIRMIAKLVELEVFDTSFFINELGKDGLDPALIPKIIEAFQQLELKPYKQQAVSTVYNHYKLGFTDKTEAIQILQAFGFHDNLIMWIIKLADMDNITASKVTLDKIIEEEYTKGLIEADKAIALKVALGINRDRAKQQVKLLDLKNFPKLKSTERDIFITDFNKLFSI